MSSLIEIAEGILALDEELQQEITADYVYDYADGSGMAISVADAEKVAEATKQWISGLEDGTLHGSNDYYHTVTSKLER
jgi:hypothetical protein